MTTHMRVGILGRVETTADEIAEEKLERSIATVGARDYLHLYFDLAGKLADARAWPATDETKHYP